MVEKVLKGSPKYYLWLIFLLAIIGYAFIVYVFQLIYGLQMTGLTRNTSWGFYIAQFTYLVGVAAAAVMLVLPATFHHYHPYHRVIVFAEFLAIGAVIMCMLFIVVDMGQPQRVLNIILHPTPNSVMFWDATVLCGYLVLNAVIAAVLFCVVTTLCLRLARRQRSKQYGSHMTAKLALTTALISVVPTLTVYAISTAFISRSLQDSFSPRVEASLDAGVRITQEMLAKQEQSTQELARDFADALAGTPDSLMLHDLLKLLEPHSGTEALVLTSTGSAVAAAGSRINVLMPDLPSQLQLKTAKTTGIYSIVDGDTLFEAPEATGGSSDLRIRVIIPISTLHAPSLSDFKTTGLLAKTASSQQLFLQLTQPVDKTIGLHAATLVAGYREYQQLAYSQSSMATLYALTLSLIVLLAVFASVLAALSFARRTTSPVMQLAEGTRRVATGDFMPIREFQGGDEINVLTRSFNSMIKEVSEARRGLELQRLQAAQAQAFLERVLGNISSGVVVVDHWYTVVTANQAARRIMGEQNVMTGASLRDTLPEFVSTLEEYQHRESIGTAPEPLDFELEQNGVTIPLYLKTTPMQLGTQTGSVLVFDDVTALMKAQRATAWGEVARRLAHEIKQIVCLHIVQR